MKGADKKKGNKWMYTPKKGEQFFFMHIPKTGGTTVRHILMNHFPEGSYYPSQKELIENNGSYLTQKQLVQNDSDILSRSLIMGHYNIKLVRHLNPNVKVITFLRNPIDRIYSHLKHIALNDPDYSDTSLDKIAEEKISNICNIQSKMLGFSQNKLVELRENIAGLDFIGIQEHFDESLEMLNGAFEWDLKPIQKRNISLNNLQSGLSKHSMSKICRRILPEIVAYNNAYQFFESRQKILAESREEKMR